MAFKHTLAAALVLFAAIGSAVSSASAETFR
ncbi:arylesterase, partial [Mesorhizobium sp. M4A.F.Ca.ET.029.04.2.1]